MSLFDTKEERLVYGATFIDNRGSLTTVSIENLCGFKAKRTYYLYNLQNNEPRGFHAHKNLKQAMICMKGSVDVILKDGQSTQKYHLNKPDQVLFIKECLWREIENFSDDAILLVLASENYDENDYIRNYDEYLSYITNKETHKKVSYVALNRLHEDLKVEISNALEDVLDGNSFIGGERLNSFEKNFSNYIGSDYTIGCGNGLDAIVLTLKALNIGHGDEVLVPANSFIASALAVDLAGAKPVFVDCNLDRYSIDLDQIEKHITKDTKAILPVSLYGIPLEVERLNDIAVKHNLMIIEDAAQAHGASFFARNSKQYPAWKASTFSFYPTKNLGALGDGGAIVTNDSVLAKTIRTLGNYGSKEKYNHIVKGYNSRLDEIQASVLDVKLKYLDKWNQKRRHLAEIYFRNLSHIEEIIIPNASFNKDSIWHVFPIRVGEHDRDRLITFLKEKNIGTNIHYPIPIHKQEAYKAHSSEQHPNAERLSKELISLPLDPYHKEDEIEYVCEMIKEFYNAT